CAFFFDLLARLRPDVERGAREALQEVEDELENCRAAWRWAVMHDASAEVMRALKALLHFFDYRARFEEGALLFREAVGMPLDEAQAAALLASIAFFEYRLDRHQDAIATSEAAFSRARNSQNRDAQVLALNVRGSCALAEGRYRVASRFFEQARR